MKTHRDLEFACVGHRKLLLDLYVPSLNPRPPLVVWIHGGGWRDGSKSKPPIRRIIEYGYALASISYRLTDEAIFPAQIHDCKAAIRWLRAHAVEYGYDASWIAAAGSSAGGHLALLLGTTASNNELEGTVGRHSDIPTDVHAIVDYYGPSDFILRAKTQADIVYTTQVGSFALLGGVDQGSVDPALEILASPSTHVTHNSPPLLAFHGTSDQRVLLDQSQRIVELFQNHGVPSELVTVKGAGHGGLDFFWGDNFERLRHFLDHSRNQQHCTTAQD